MVKKSRLAIYLKEKATEETLACQLGGRVKR